MNDIEAEIITILKWLNPEVKEILEKSQNTRENRLKEFGEVLVESVIDQEGMGERKFKDDCPRCIAKEHPCNFLGHVETIDIDGRDFIWCAGKCIGHKSYGPDHCDKVHERRKNTPALL